MLRYVQDFNKPLKSFLATKFFAYSQEAFFKFLINIYFWRITEDISFLVLYNIIFQIAHGISYFPAGKISKEYNRFLPLRFGLVVQLFFLGSILFLKESVVDYIVPVAIIGGIAHGAYWSSDNLLKFDLTNPKNRFRFTAVHHILKKTAYGVVPLVASILVIANGDVISSYSGIFLAALAITVLAIISTFFISKKKNFTKENYAPVSVSKKLFKNNNIKIVCWSTLLRYIAEVLPTLLGLVLFFSSGTELSIGSYQFVTVFVAIFANYFAGKYFSKKDYKKLLFYGGLINFLLIFILFVRQDFTSILIYGILTSIFSIANNPTYPLSQDALNIYAKSKKELLAIRVEYVTIHEMFVVIGKIIGLLVLLLLHYSLSMIAIAAIIFALAQLAANIYLTKVEDGKTTTIDLLN